MEEPKFLADEMLGRLARYLRFLGFDTGYVRGLTDEAVAEQAAAEGRTLLTRDRRLASRVAQSVLLLRSDVSDQITELRAALTGLPWDVRFLRCTLCNGRLALEHEVTLEDPEAARAVAARGEDLYRCEACRHLYWEGSHTAQMRTRVAAPGASGR